MLARGKETKMAWVRCPACGHKLFRVSNDVDELVIGVADGEECNLEVKCHSCKAVVSIRLKEGE